MLQLIGGITLAIGFAVLILGFGYISRRMDQGSSKHA